MTERRYPPDWDRWLLPTSAAAVSTPDEPPRSDAYLRGRENIGALKVYSAAELAARVDARGPRKWLLRGIWPAGDYGVMAAEPKAQKTWTAYDIAVSVAAGVDWLAFIKVETIGPVLIFVGEGGEEETVRRMRAIAASKGLRFEDLRIAIVTRAPHLSDQDHLDEMAAHIDRIRPVLVILDPLYLSAGGANGASLYDMGAVLERPQHLCQAVGASLLVVHHSNRKEGKGASRISGAGPAEWGRVLITAAVKSRRRDPQTWETTVVTEMDIIGGGIAGGDLRVTRRIRVDSTEPDDLNAPLEYHVIAEWSDPGGDDDGDQAADDPLSKLRPAARRVLTVLRATTGEMTVSTIGDEIAKAAVGTTDSPLKARTIQDGLKALREAGFADKVDGHGFADLWFALRPEEDAPNAA